MVLYVEPYLRVLHLLRSNLTRCRPLAATQVDPIGGGAARVSLR
jgi:hypothetical protein